MSTTDRLTGITVAALLASLTLAVAWVPPRPPPQQSYLLLRAMLHRPGGPTKVVAGPGRTITIDAQPLEMPLGTAAVLLDTDGSLNLDAEPVLALFRRPRQTLPELNRMAGKLPLPGDQVVWCLAGRRALSEEEASRLNLALGEHWTIRAGKAEVTTTKTTRLDQP